MPPSLAKLAERLDNIHLGKRHHVAHRITVSALVCGSILLGILGLALLAALLALLANLLWVWE